jgi:prophage antirepressor-like protein
VFFILDEINNPWFKAKDVCDILEYTNPQKVIRDNVREKYHKLYEI